VAEFDYTAVNRDGRSVSGRIEAESRDAALRLLNTQGVYPIDAVPAVPASATVPPSPTAGAASSMFERKPTSAEITLFSRELSLLLSAGQPLSKTLALIEEDSSAQRIQKLARRLRTSITTGKSFDEALTMEGSHFPPIYVGMVKAAEASGKLQSVLERIADTREREHKLKGKITSALIYPILLIATAIGSVLLMMILVVPRFKDMFGAQVQQLSASSRAVLATSDWLTQNAETLGIAAVVISLAILLAGRSTLVQKSCQRSLMGLPVIGSLMRLSLTVRFCRTLGVLLSAGLGLPAALALTRDVIGNDTAETLIDRIGAALREGTEFTEPLAGSSVFPSMVTSLLRIGAESGTLSASALRLADMYESKLEIAMQRFVTVLEPAIILFVSLFIGFIVLSIVGAIMSVYDVSGA
jgi:general secretion pathway protein F